MSFMYFTSSPDSALSTTRRSLMYPSKVGLFMSSRFKPMSKTVWSFSFRSKRALETLLLPPIIPSMNRTPSFLSRLQVNATCIHLLGMIFLWLWENIKENEALHKSPLLSRLLTRVNCSEKHTWVLYVSPPIY